MRQKCFYSVAYPILDFDECSSFNFHRFENNFLKANFNSRNLLQHGWSFMVQYQVMRYLKFSGTVALNTQKWVFRSWGNRTHDLWIHRPMS